MTNRIHIALRGAVQGVGFRPFIYRLAANLGLAGWVANTPQGLFAEAEGEKDALDAFVLRIQREAPPLARIQSFEFSFLDPCGYTTFAIRESIAGGETSALVLPDIAPCPECRAEVLDPSNRRFRYPFTNCTHCGPRFTIIESLPYDRPNTSMKGFPMCEDCRREYEDPADRRFHAQPTACPVCGPQLALWDRTGGVKAERHDALLQAARLIRSGAIVALKGLGGFQLIVDARNHEAVRRLRQRKGREEKPFALMAPDTGRAAVLCTVSALEERLLTSPEAPIVLLRKRTPGGTRATPGTEHAILDPDGPVAPHNPTLGVMLPSTPLHFLLMQELGFPVVATSGNLSDEPICTDEHEACERLGEIADAFLVHNRPIVRHADDSVGRIMMGRELLLRRARGYSPLPIGLPAASAPVLAVGAHLKSAIAVAKGGNVFISQHIGDLETKQSYDAFERAVADMQNMFAVRPAAVVSDMHPDYLSTQFASALSVPRIAVQHHHAHITSCMAENQIDGRALGVSWDGTGLGTDGSVWGGEFLLAEGSAFRRIASFRPFRLPGGDRAIKEPRRAALGVLFELCGSGAFDRTESATLRSFRRDELSALRTMLTGGIHAPFTTSVGRLFDAVASLTGLKQINSFEGQAAMELEFSLPDDATEEAYDIPIRSHTARRGGDPASGTRPGDAGRNGTDCPDFQADWGDMMRAILEDVAAGVAASRISAKFHNALAAAVVAVARRTGERRVVLSGGCFQNVYLTQRTVRLLRDAGFQPYWHQRVPPNDGGIALGQIYVAALQRGNGAS
jgi:hydrogenase maturation protein HypF